MIDPLADPALARLSPSLLGLLMLKAVTRGLCARRLPAVLGSAAVPPPRGRAWTRTDLAAAEHTLRRLGFVDAGGRCRRPLEHELAKRGTALHPAVLRALPADTAPGALADNLNLRLRLAVYSGDVTALPRIRADFTALSAAAPDHPPRVLHGGGFADLPADAAWAATLPPAAAGVILDDCLPLLLEQGALAPILSVLPAARIIEELGEASGPRLLFLVLCGRPEAAERLAAADTADDGLTVRGLNAFFQGRVAEAATLLREARKRLRPGRKLGLDRAPALCLITALAAEGGSEQAAAARGLTECPDTERRLGRAGLTAVRSLLCLARGRKEEARELLDDAPETAADPLSRLLLDIGRARCGLPALPPDPAREVLPLLDRLAAAAQGEPPRGAAAALTPPLLDPRRLCAPASPEQQRLEDVLRLLKPAPRRPARLIWLLHPDTGVLEPLEQTRGPQGWSAGRPASLKRLCGPDAPDHLDEQDRRILACAAWSRLWNGLRCALDPIPALCAAAGHPLLFRAGDRQPVTLIREDTALEVTAANNGLRLRLSRRVGTACDSDGNALPDLELCGPDTYRIWVHPPRAAEVEAALGPEGLFVPADSAAAVPEKLDNLTVPVRFQADAPPCPGDPRPVLRLRPHGEGLAVQAVVRPLGPDGPALPPGRGAPELVDSAHGVLQRTRRDLAAETRALADLLAACPLPTAARREPDLWLFPDLESALDLLLALGALPDPPRLEWPEGRSLSPRPPLDASALNLQAADAGGLFRLHGGIADGPDLGALLAGLEKRRGKYIPLGEGAFLALTERFRDLLERLAVLTEEDRDGARLFRGPVGPALAAALEEAGSTADLSAVPAPAAARAAADLHPLPPPGLQATLRPYQQEGFVRLFRLARWAGGACLADEMGLGKTVQAAALLLAEAESGPSLVVAPLSVCRNWEQELARFTPGLRVRRRGDGDQLRAGDVLVISYGRLRAETALAGQDWNIVVFDEAQALKNPTTQQARAARDLRARFRLALTGTPVENRLEDLWSLFAIILPGLLGSLPAFRQRFPRNADDGVAPAALKALTRPYILRRTKAEVLPDLPPRTEHIREVILPPDERAFYDALRRRAAADLGDRLRLPDGQRRLHILAWLTKLRRACCHPTLVDPDSALPGAKLTALLDLARELRAAGRRALIFSQFTGHLALVRTRLEQTGAVCLYLDGGTPENERARTVAAFQAGEGDLFLISLRAGGRGLNLTAADFVIHLDPWWNPAVEDQASDRAHRLGQARPVDICRLIVKDSVEENILRLHEAKRRLADDFLEGAALSEQELLALLGA